MYKFILPLVVLFVLVASCKKDNNDVKEDTPAFLIAGDTGKVWIDSYRDQTLPDNSVQVETRACYNDDYWVFKPDGRFEWNEGGSKCSESDPYTYASGKWRLSEDGKMILFSDVSVPGVKPGFTYHILQLTSSTLSVTIDGKDIFVSTDPVRLNHRLQAK